MRTTVTPSVPRSPAPLLPVLLVVVAVALGGCLPVPDAPSPTASPSRTAGSPGPPATPSPTTNAPAASPSFVYPTPTPLPTFLSYVVVSGDTLTSIARRYSTTPRSIAYWNRAKYPSLDPDSPAYKPDRIEVGWTLVLIPGGLVDENDLPPAPSASASTPAPTLPPGPTPQPGGSSLLVSHGSRSARAVALTFDMGGRLDPALDIIAWLVDHDIRATVFPTGEVASTTAVGQAVLAQVAAHPELFAIGNHSWDHPDFRDLDAAAIASQLDRTETAVEESTGRSTKPFFRPPYGGENAAVLKAVGAAGWAYTVVWDVDTIDWRAPSDGGPSAADIEAKVLSRVQGGSIVLMHLGGWHTLEALPGIVDGLRARGYEPVTLEDLLLAP